MIKIYIVSYTNKHFDTAILEYIKRLWRTCEILKIKPKKNENINLLIDSETNEIIDKISKIKAFKIVLNPAWKALNTDIFSDLIEKNKSLYPNIIFIIWWANWLNYHLLNDKVDFNLSLSLLTMPHSLALLVLLEQIYRASMILKWSNYNK